MDSGCLIEVRLIGVISAEQSQDGEKESNDRLLGVAIHSYNHEEIKTIDDVSKTILAQLEEKKFKITGTGGPRKAIKFLKAGMRKQKG